MRRRRQRRPARRALRPDRRGDRVRVARRRRLTIPTPVSEEALPDGRTLVVHDDGTIEVRGLSERPAEAARIGYLPRAQRARPPRPVTTPPRPPRPEDPWDVADRLLDSLLDERQRRDRRRHGRWWVRTDRGWLQLGGTPHDLRFRPDAEPGREWSLCVVPTDKTLPPGDVWSTLLLTATGLPDTFFRVAHRSPPPSPTRHPRDPTG